MVEIIDFGEEPDDRCAKTCDSEEISNEFNGGNSDHKDERPFSFKVASELIVCKIDTGHSEVWLMEYQG